MTGTNGQLPSWARVGAKVVCVDDSQGAISSANDLVLGRIYTLASVTDKFSEPACQVVEMRLADWEFVRLSRFRPVVDDDIETAIYRAKGLHSRSPRNGEVDA